MVDLAAPEDPETAGCIYAITAQSYMLILVSFEHKDKKYVQTQACHSHSQAGLTSHESYDVKKHNSQ